MAGIIGDGYDWLGKVADRQFIYRPMLSRERRVAINSMKWLGNKHGFAYANDVILNHVCYGIDKAYVSYLMIKDQEKWLDLWLTICGIKGDGTFFNGWEKSTAENLRSGVRLYVRNPKLAARSCNQCREYWYDDNGDRVQENGRDMKRIPEAPVACETTNGCLAGHYLKQLRLSPINKMAYLHFQDCQAVDIFPDDPIVARNARIIRSEERRKWT